MMSFMSEVASKHGRRRLRQSAYVFDSVESPVVAAHIDRPVRPDCGRGEKRGTWDERPGTSLLSSVRVQRVNPPVVRSNDDGAIGCYGGRRIDERTGCERPARFRGSGARVEGIHLAVLRSHV